MDAYAFLRALAQLQQMGQQGGSGTDYSLPPPQPMVPADILSKFGSPTAQQTPRGSKLGRGPDSGMRIPIPDVAGWFRNLTGGKPGSSAVIPVAPLAVGQMAPAAPQPEAGPAPTPMARPARPVASIAPAPVNRATTASRPVAASARRAMAAPQTEDPSSTNLLNQLALELAKGTISYDQFMAALEKERSTRGAANRTYQGLLEGV